LKSLAFITARRTGLRNFPLHFHCATWSRTGRRFGRPLLENREKWRTPSYFRSMFKNKPTLYCPVGVAHPPSNPPSGAKALILLVGSGTAEAVPSPFVIEPRCRIQVRRGGAPSLHEFFAHEKAGGISPSRVVLARSNCRSLASLGMTIPSKNEDDNPSKG
jgi:hypothetical protein